MKNFVRSALSLRRTSVSCGSGLLFELMRCGFLPLFLAAVSHSIFLRGLSRVLQVPEVRAMTDMLDRSIVVPYMLLVTYVVNAVF